MLEVSRRELNWLLDGIDVFRLRSHAELTFSAVRPFHRRDRCVRFRCVGEGAGPPQDVESLRARLIEIDAAIAERDTEIAQLREYIRLPKSQRSGASSERAHRDQLELFNEAEASANALQRGRDREGQRPRCLGLPPPRLR